MFTGSIFSVLIDWLALATGGEAKAAEAPALGFPMPPKPPTFMQLSERRPASRACCAMGQPLPQRAAPIALDPETLWKHPHRFRSQAETGALELMDDVGGTIGYVYTRFGGFIDLGHARDFIDLTSFFTQMYLNVAENSIHGGSTFLFKEDADIYLEAEQLATPRDYAISALIGAKLAFEYSVWHEISSYFTVQSYSSFAPEDLFSNALGAVAGFRALFNTKVEFNIAANQALKELLEQLGMESKATTEAAIEYVKDRWWKKVLFEKFPVAKRRNFLSAGAIKPWLVTDLTIRGKEATSAELEQAMGKPPPASITFPTHYNGIFLDGRARLFFKNPMQEIKDLVKEVEPPISEIRSINLPTVSEQLRAHARKEEEASIDSP
jgi:Protein of unknown function (DUF4056)